MMNVYVFEKGCVAPIPNSDGWAKQKLIKFIYASSDLHANKLFSEAKPDVIYSVGPTFEAFKTLIALPLYIRFRWLHAKTKSEIEGYKIQNCFTDCFNKNVGPKISIFSSAFESAEKIMRPFKSLKEQDYKEWEWVILDDSKTPATWNKELALIAQSDCRVRLFRGKHNDGFIGSVKRDVAMMCRGEYLVELDHDDELLPSALSDIIHAFESDPTVGFLGSDCIELYEKTLKVYNYGGFYGFGFHAYYKELYEGKWVDVARNGPLNKFTLRHIIGVLNHVRAFRRSAYVELGGHDHNLSVADDYELILRFWLSDKWKVARVPKFLYKQYRNEGGNNFTFLRNAYIQYLVKLVKNKYDDAIHAKLLKLGMDDEGTYKSNIDTPKENAYYNWHYDPTADIVLDPRKDAVSIVMPTYNRADQVTRSIKSVLAQSFQNWILYVIGDKCPVLDNVMKQKWAHDSRIRWWNLHENSGEGSRPRNYALKQLVTTDIVCYLDDDNKFEPNHVETLYKALKYAVNGAMFAFSSFFVPEDDMFILCSKPVKYRIDTSCVMHYMSLFKKHGYWRTIKEYGYAIDWDLVGRWVKGNEPWVATKMFTLHYSNWQQDMNFIKNVYDDQKEVENVKMHISTELSTTTSDDDNHIGVKLHMLDITDEKAEEEQEMIQKVILESPISITHFPVDHTPTESSIENVD